MAPDTPVWQPTILTRPEKNMTISVGSEWTINALSITQASGRAPNVMFRQLHWYSNLDWEPTQSREPAL